MRQHLVMNEQVLYLVCHSSSCLCILPVGSRRASCCPDATVSGLAQVGRPTGVKEAPPACVRVRATSGFGRGYEPPNSKI